MSVAGAFLAVDWGTTNRRVFLIDGGQVVRTERDDKGVTSVQDFAAEAVAIRERFGDLPMLLAGMVGSNIGWRPAPYVAAPAGVAELAAGLLWIDDRIAIVPGISTLVTGRPDVMRGEEVQLLGAAAAGLIDPDALVCHPGTHNKWVMLREGRIHHFRTVMTGELFSLLKDHSILADLLQGKVELSDSFRQAAQHAIYHEALPSDLFGVRASVLLGQLNKQDAASYASGLLIGADVRIGLSKPGGAEIHVIGRPELTGLYAAAIEQAARRAIPLDGERCFLAGAFEIAKRI